MTFSFLIVLLGCVLNSCIFGKTTRESLHTAISSMTPLIKSHKTIMDKLERYIEGEEKKLNIISTFLKRYVEEDNKTSVYYTLNPLNAFTLIKRTTRDIDTLTDFTLNSSKAQDYIKLRDPYVQKTVHQAVEFVIIRIHSTFPKEVDLIGACTSVFRIQEAYDINATSLVKGEFRGMKLSAEMTVEDRYELGSCLYRSGEFRAGINWFTEAYHGFRQEYQKDFYSFTEAGIISQISYGYNTLNNSYEAFLWLKKLLDIEHSVEAEYEAYKKAIYHYEKQKPYAINKTVGGIEVKLQLDDKNKYLTYKKTCKGEAKISDEIAKRLKCSYLSETHPFLKIAPIKTEQLYIDPDIFLFYDLIHDHESRILKIRALPELSQSYLKQTSTGELSNSVDIRICKSAWAYESDLTDKLSQRIEDCTGLNVDSSELLQITNYGVAGYFTPHFDNFSENATKSFERDRLATTIFYMTDVIEGATVFPELALKVTPIKGSMLYFDNLLPTGEGDPRALHAGCPVLQGDKWIAVKWIHTPGQELSKKCSLYYKPVYLAVPQHIISGYPGVIQKPRKKRNI